VKIKKIRRIKKEEVEYYDEEGGSEEDKEREINGLQTH